MKLMWNTGKNVMLDLWVLGCPEPDLAVFGKCVSVCASICMSVYDVSFVCVLSLDSEKFYETLRLVNYHSVECVAIPRYSFFLRQV